MTLSIYVEIRGDDDDELRKLIAKGFKFATKHLKGGGALFIYGPDDSQIKFHHEKGKTYVRSVLVDGESK